MKISVMFVSVMTMLAFVVVPDSQASPKTRLDEATQICRILTFQNSGWVSEGSKIFENSCKGCHNRDNDVGAPFLYSESKTMKGWNRVFLERYPQCAKDGKWADITGDDLLKLNDYLYRNAANTYDPNDADDCG